LIVGPPQFDLAGDGLFVTPPLIAQPQIAALIAALERPRPADATRRRGGRVYALRNLLSVPAVRALAESQPIGSIVAPVVGPRWRCVRGILFDKMPGANWKVAWHQDLSIAVRRRVDVPGFGPWSVKAGVTHVQPPAGLLARLLTVRVHLDDCGPDNGPLKVLPGSHARGVLTPAEVSRWPRDAAPVDCTAAAGAAVVMRPLLLHASSSATRPGHRRVIHLEYAGEELPGGLEWDAAMQPASRTHSQDAACAT
jgi:hypothetical protein